MSSHARVASPEGAAAAGMPDAAAQPPAADSCTGDGNGNGNGTSTSTSTVTGTGSGSGSGSGVGTGANTSTSTGKPAVDPAAADIPAWLAERLREDADSEAERQRKRMWTRRALGWSAGLTVLAVLGVTGFWMVQESRDDGALLVVANTSAPASVAANSVAVAASATPGRAPLSGADPPMAPHITVSASETGKSAPDAGASAPDIGTIAPDAGTSAPHVDTSATDIGISAPHVAASVPDTGGSAPHISTSSPHAHAHATRRRAPAPAGAGATRASPAAAPDFATPAHQREETLMQCQARGYDDAQCRQRGCAMTRFGLACKG